MPAQPTLLPTGGPAPGAGLPDYSPLYLSVGAQALLAALAPFFWLLKVRRSRATADVLQEVHTLREVRNQLYLNQLATETELAQTRENYEHERREKGTFQNMWLAAQENTRRGREALDLRAREEREELQEEIRRGKHESEMLRRKYDHLRGLLHETRGHTQSDAV